MTDADEQSRKFQFEAATQGAGFCFALDTTLIEISGTDRASFLHNLCTADIKSLPVGEGCELFFTDVRGRTIGYGWVVAENDSLVVASAPGQADTILSHLDRYLIREDVQLFDRTAVWQQAVLCGERAEAIVENEWNIRLGPLEFSHAHGTIGTIDMHCGRIPFYGVPGFTIRTARDDRETVAAQLELCAEECDASILEFLRIRAGTPRFGVDITDANLPQEIDRDRQAISFNKGCYLGQETVARIDALGQVQQLLRRLQIHTEDAIPSPGTMIEHEEKSVGRITSAIRSPADAHVFALGFVRRPQANPGTRLHCSCGDVDVIE